MSIEEEISKSIEQQFTTHSRTNLFYKHLETGRQFLPESKVIIKDQKHILLQMNNECRGDQWIDLMTNYAFRTFCTSNQFLDLREEHLSILRDVYSELWQDIITEIQKCDIDFDLIQRNHLKRLTNWVKQTNNFVYRINGTNSPEIITVVCAEYSCTLQLHLLHIDLDSLRGPVLDVGCGEHAHLVRYLQNKGFETFGMDRISDANKDSHFIKTDWMDYTFQPGSWGSVVANNSFTLHFVHQNERTDSDYLSYAKKYMEILHSLQKGGTFYYAPSLPFIECYLPEDTYGVSLFRINENYSSAHIIRKK